MKKSTKILVVFGHCSHNHQTLIITPSHEISESNRWTGEKKLEHQQQGLQIWDHVYYFKHLFWRVNKFETETISQYVWKKKTTMLWAVWGNCACPAWLYKKSPPVLESTLFTCEKTWKNHRSFTPHEEFRSSKLFSGLGKKNRNLAHKKLTKIRGENLWPIF